ncbi:MAG: DeoR/GlpR family DNA-binding transcription regulator [Actinomycetota bacterium]|nr:DeoR/GlpR family DNA-binding transcription regulator [Actinomycetota bacterium]
MAKRGRPSLARQRHELIVSQVRRGGAVRVAELAEQLDVSEMTVRRDLDALHEAGLIVKVHGGATVRYERGTDEPPFQAKSTRNTREKAAIAASAAVMTGPGSAVGLTGGTTTVRLAAELVTLPDLTVVTNNLRVADVFHQHPRADRTVVIVGGERTPSDALVGPVAVASLRTFNLDTVFMGVHGIHERAGFTTPNLREADTNRAFAESTDELVVLADNTKWGVSGLVTIAPLDEATVCVSDAGLSEPARAVLRDQVGRLVIAEGGSLGIEGSA